VRQVLASIAGSLLAIQIAISCPHCGSKNVEQEAAAFFAVTGKKS
jgi:hypothetical protein